jgi:predicted transcriptional regulator of viral defense system
MRVFDLKKIDKFFFGYEDISRALAISKASAKITATRYVKQGILLRVKRNLYVLKDVWAAADRDIRFKVVNMGQVPSYISLMTALDYYEITTQVQRDYFESIALKRSKVINVGGSVFKYIKIAPDLYNGFKREKDFFISTPEKALLDSFYLMSYGRYSLDLSSLDGNRLDRQEIERMSYNYPLKTRKMLERNGYL